MEDDRNNAQNNNNVGVEELSNKGSNGGNNKRVGRRRLYMEGRGSGGLKPRQRAINV